MGRRLYVGNLAWTVTDQDLQDVFSEAGKVESSQVIIDRATNRSRGFGFVEMATDEAADAAIKNIDLSSDISVLIFPNTALSLSGRSRQRLVRGACRELTSRAEGA